MEQERVVDWMVYRKGLLDMWGSKDISFVNQKRLDLISSAKNQLRDHMQPKDLAGILKENRGVKIYDHNGKNLNHIGEWGDAKESMIKALKAMQTALHDTKTSVAEKECKRQINHIYSTS